MNSKTDNVKNKKRLSIWFYIISSLSCSGICGAITLIGGNTDYFIPGCVFGFVIAVVGYLYGTAEEIDKELSKEQDEKGRNNASFLIYSFVLASITCYFVPLQMDFIFIEKHVDFILWIALLTGIFLLAQYFIYEISKPIIEKYKGRGRQLFYAVTFFIITGILAILKVR